MTGGFPFELVAVAVAVTGLRGDLSLATTTKTTVPVGVGAAAVTTTLGPVGADGAGVAVGDALVSALTAAVALVDGGAECGGSQPEASRATGMSRPSQAGERPGFN